jgi:NAD(P)-dependent dehydrogenase (short-subunit alcohol dehydrogenase family)
MSLDGRVALITGAGRGIGAGIARSLAEAGAHVVVNDLHAERAAATAAAIDGIGGGKAVARAFDVTDHAAVVAAVAATEAELGPIDLLVNNAGIPETMAAVKFIDSSPESWPPYLNLNLLGSMNCIHTVLPRMVEREFGRVVQISSGASTIGQTSGVSLYGASKAGIEGLIRHVAIEVAKTGVTANALALGLMENTAGKLNREVLDPIMRSIPVGRLGGADEAGAAVAWLCSDLGGFVTGQVIHLSGGAIHGR